MGQKCYACGEYDGITIHHGHDPEVTDCPEDGACHSYCLNCDNGTCGED